MRLAATVGCALLLGLVPGCLSLEPASAPVCWLDRLMPWHGQGEVEVVLMEVVLIERPVGDPYLKDGLWQYADEQTISLEKKAILEDNGFRIGQLGGATPARLQTLLCSESSCANPRRIQLRAGSSRNLVVGPPVAKLAFTIQSDESADIELGQAECTLQVVPTLSNDGRTLLRFTPTIPHGDKKLQFSPAKDQPTWALQEEQPTESYSALSWEMALAPNEVALVGARFERSQTLGHRYFIRPEETIPVQRLLLIRTSRSLRNKSSENYLSAEEEERLPRSPALAIQAALSSGPTRN